MLMSSRFVHEELEEVRHALLFRGPDGRYWKFTYRRDITKLVAIGELKALLEQIGVLNQLYPLLEFSLDIQGSGKKVYLVIE